MPLRKEKVISVILLVIIFFAPVFAQEGVVLSTTKQGGLATDENATSTQAGITRDGLLLEIEEKNRQLEDLNKEIEATKQNLQDTQKQKQSLQKELNILTNTINQLNLNIKADGIRIEKLGLEIESLGFDMKNIQASLGDRRLAISRLLIELQKNDYPNASLLLIFLRGGSLADGFLEIQSIKNLQSQLAVDITNLVDLHDKYGLKIKEADEKKKELSYQKKNLEQRKYIIEDKKGERKTILSVTKNQEGTYQKQLTELEKLQKQIANEIESLGAILRTQIDPAVLPKPEPGVLGIPIKTEKERITQDYGATKFAEYGYKGKWHNGIDLGTPVGTPVIASEDGVIAATGDQDKFCYRGAYGKFIVVNHKNNLTTLYAHLSRVIVKDGQEVRRGDVVGYSGMSGYATGPHLHLTVFAQPTFYMGPSKVCGQMPFGGDLNPAGYL